MPSGEATVERQAALDAVRAALPAYPGGHDGRGIVICAGGSRLFTCAWVCIGLLRRHLGCTLPIEVWHLGPEEMGPPMRSLLQEFGDVAVVDALEVARRQPVRRLGGWELKPYAVLHARFREVLLLDADNCPTIDPSFLFETEPYRRAGAIFWPDIDRLRPENPLWAICRLAFRSEPAFESGQLVIDKARCWDALSLAMHLNEHSDFYYQHLHGDKDTFHLAWLMLGRSYAMPAMLPRATPLVLFQRDFEGRVIFQHRTGAKWVLQGENQDVPGFRDYATCLALIDALRGVWDGRVFLPPPPTSRTTEAERELLATGRFTYRRIGSDERPLELLPANRVGAGSNPYEMNWHLEDGEEDAVVLVFSGSGTTTARLARRPDGSWAGAYLVKERFPVELVAARPPAAHTAHRAQTARTTPPGLLDDVLAAYGAIGDSPSAAGELRAALALLCRAYGDLAGLLRDRLAQDATLPPAARLAIADLLAQATGAPSLAPVIGDRFGQRDVVRA